MKLSGSNIDLGAVVWVGTSFLVPLLETRWSKEQASQAHWLYSTTINFGVSHLRRFDWMCCCQPIA